MMRAKFRHLRERASSVLFDADRVSYVQLSGFWTWARNCHDPARKYWGWMAHEPVVKRGQK